MNIMIIDTGCANLSSVQFALQRLGYTPRITDDIDILSQADRLLLPGVGTANFAMQNLTQRGLDTFIKTTQTPLLGICLGMQLLTSSSDEGKTDTLGLIPTHTKVLNTHGLPLPHMGWNSICFDDHPLFEGINSKAHVYFVHSYGVPVGDCTLATCEYGEPFSAVIAKDNYFGMQFHPEKSGKIGSQLLRNFVENLS